MEDQSTFNRATLHLAPIIGVWLVLLVKRALASAPPVERAPVEAQAPTALATPAPVAVPAEGPDA